MEIREYNVNKFFYNIFNLWKEVGWLKDNEIDKKGLEIFLEGGDNLAVFIDNKIVGCLTSFNGNMNAFNNKLNFMGLAGIIVSPFFRKKKIASKMIVESIKKAANDGNAVSGLIMFEQGYYDKFGYALGTYDNVVTFDPSKLKVDYPSNSQAKLSYNDWQKMYMSYLERNCNHGNVTVKNKKIFQALSCWGKKSDIGFGIFNNEKKLSHYFWGNIANLNDGKLFIDNYICNNNSEFEELLKIIKTLEDQVHTVKIKEPVNIQLQNFIEKPFKSAFKSSKFSIKSKAIWQFRILDIENCINKLFFPYSNLEFNLCLEDPIEEYLNLDSNWKGVGGKYNIYIGEKSFAKKGFKSSLMTLKCSVNAFSKMWLGISPASILTVTNELKGPNELIKKLDNIYRFMPKPQMDGFPRIPRKKF